MQLGQKFEEQLKRIERLYRNGYITDHDLQTEVKPINNAIDNSNLGYAEKHKLQDEYFDINKIKNDSAGNGNYDEDLSSLELLKRNLTNAIEYLKETKDKEEGTKKHFAIKFDYDYFGLISHTVHVAGDLKGKLTLSKVNEIKTHEESEIYRNVKQVSIYKFDSKKDADEFCKKSNYISYLKIAASILAAGASAGFFGWTMSKLLTYESPIDELKNRESEIDKMLDNSKQLSAESVEELNKELTSIEDKMQHAMSEGLKVSFLCALATIVFALVVITILESRSLCQKKFKDEDKIKTFDLTTEEGCELFNQTFDVSLQEKDLDKTKWDKINESQSDQYLETQADEENNESLSLLIDDFNIEGLDGKLQTESQPKHQYQQNSKVKKQQLHQMD
jgi:hypothetical protein